MHYPEASICVDHGLEKYEEFFFFTIRTHFSINKSSHTIKLLL